MPTIINDEQQRNILDDIVDENTNNCEDEATPRPLWAHYSRNSRFRQSAYNEHDKHADTLVAISYLEYAIKHHNSSHKIPLTNEDISNILHWYFILNDLTNIESKKRIENYFNAYYE